MKRAHGEHSCDVRTKDGENEGGNVQRRNVVQEVCLFFVQQLGKGKAKYQWRKKESTCVGLKLGHNLRAFYSFRFLFLGFYLCLQFYLRLHHSSIPCKAISHALLGLGQLLRKDDCRPYIKVGRQDKARDIALQAIQSPATVAAALQQPASSSFSSLTCLVLRWLGPGRKQNSIHSLSHADLGDFGGLIKRSYFLGHRRCVSEVTFEKDAGKHGRSVAPGDGGLPPICAEFHLLSKGVHHHVTRLQRVLLSVRQARKSEVRLVLAPAVLGVEQHTPCVAGSGVKSLLQRPGPDKCPVLFRRTARTLRIQRLDACAGPLGDQHPMLSRLAL